MKKSQFFIALKLPDRRRTDRALYQAIVNDSDDLDYIMDVMRIAFLSFGNALQNNEEDYRLKLAKSLRTALFRRGHQLSHDEVAGFFSYLIYEGFVSFDPSTNVLSMENHCRDLPQLECAGA